MSTILTFITAPVSTSVIDRFLTEAQWREVACNSLCAVVRDQSVALDALETPGTEPPVSPFASGFLGASDADLWSALDGYRAAEARRDRAGFLEDNIVLALDDRSAADDTVVMLYRARDGRTVHWRLRFRFVLVVTPDLRDEEETYLRPDLVDDRGVFNPKKAKEAIGVTWRYGDL